MANKKWADGPYKLLSTPRAALMVKITHNLQRDITDKVRQEQSEDGASRNASEMALIHNILIRGLNCITLQAINVKKSEDIMDFMSFCDAWSCALHSHHNTEETVYFPLLEEQSTEKGVMAKNHAEHEIFLPGLLAFDEYIRGVQSDVKLYEGSKVVKIVDSFGPALETHLQNEIVLLESLAKDEKIDWDLMGKTMAAHSKKVADRVCVSALWSSALLLIVTRSAKSLF
jgi:hemerythrin-like domain-containing protein